MRYLAAVALTLAAAACSAPRLTPADAKRLIEAHPRFTRPETIVVPARYCTRDPDDPAPPPPQGGTSRIKSMADVRIIALAVRAAKPNECPQEVDRAVVTVTLTDLAGGFHPTPLPDGRGWEFVLAHRRFLRVDDISYDNPDNPKMSHVGYAWAWDPDLLGQLVLMGSVPQGASATFLRDGNGWIVRQPGM